MPAAVSNSSLSRARDTKTRDNRQTADARGYSGGLQTDGALIVAEWIDAEPTAETSGQEVGRLASTMASLAAEQVAR